MYKRPWPVLEDTTLFFSLHPNVDFLGSWPLVGSPLSELVCFLALGPPGGTQPSRPRALLNGTMVSKQRNQLRNLVNQTGPR